MPGLILQLLSMCTVCVLFEAHTTASAHKIAASCAPWAHERNCHCVSAVLLSVIQGVLFGSLHVFEELVLPPAEPLKGTAVDNPTRRR